MLNSYKVTLTASLLEERLIPLLNIATETMVTLMSTLEPILLAKPALRINFHQERSKLLSALCALRDSTKTYAFPVVSTAVTLSVKFACKIKNLLTAQFAAQN